MFIHRNGKIVKADQALISLDERGYLFGDGIFETCKIFAGEIYDFQSHQRRIEKGLKQLKISADITDLKKDCQTLIRKNQIKNGILRIEISRGIGSIGYLPTNESKSLIIVRTLEQREIPKKISLGISYVKKPSGNLFLAECKSMNAIPSILAKIESQEKSLFDCIMLSAENFISETSSANIFWVKNGQVFTPSKDCYALPGTTQARLRKISPLKIVEAKKTISALKNADEIFLTNSSFLVLPVDELRIGNTKKLQKNFGKMFLDLMQKDVEESCRK